MRSTMPKMRDKETRRQGDKETPPLSVSLSPPLRVSLSLLAALALFLCGCDRKTMHNQGRVKPLEPSGFFVDGKSSRSLLPGTVARSALTGIRTSSQRELGGSGKYPFEITEDVLHRGQERFNIHCSVCHGYLGDGRGMVVQRGFTQPPSFHEPRLRDVEPDQHYYDVISNGWGAMYSYGDRLSPSDRWAIIAYIRALQISQHAPPELAAAVPAKPNAPEKNEQ
jgi:hypothetical protein